MNKPAVDFPSLAKVATALRQVTETLAHEVTVPTETPPAWDDFEWRIARAVASMQGISSLLGAGLRWQRPHSWRRFLESQRNHTAGRHRRIERLLEKIDSQARQAGIALVALKGAALHANGIYQPGDRPMADIDLLAQPADVKAVTSLLERCEYENTFSSWRDQLFEPRVKRQSVAFGEHVDNPIKIELHTRIRERLPVNETEITAFLLPRAASPGINSYQSPAFLMMHLLLHAAGNMRARALRMIQLHDIAKLAERFVSGDWEELLTTRPNGQALWWAMPPLMLTARYYAGAIPAFVFVRLQTECPWLLSRITRAQLVADVSWSNIKVHALPGIEWSQSPREALVFVVRRILPSRDARLELRRFSAYHSGGSEIPWYGISQAARVLRWVFSRPSRVQTLLTVRAALSQQNDESIDRVATEG
jgi:putative nucleotidyltransferase-like protein